MLAHFVVIPVNQIDTTSTVITSQFFTLLFGPIVGGRIVPIFIAISSLGCTSCIAFGASRVILIAAQERQLPFPATLSRTTSQKSPAAALILSMLVTLVLILAPPPGAIYQVRNALFSHVVSFERDGVPRMDLLWIYSGRIALFKVHKSWSRSSFQEFDCLGSLFCNRGHLSDCDSVRASAGSVRRYSVLYGTSRGTAVCAWGDPILVFWKK